VDVVVARSFRERLLGLAFRAQPPVRPLLIPDCRSVHTFGMRFALDLVWLDRKSEVLTVERRIPPNRLRTRREAAAVIEAPADEGERVAAAWRLRSAAWRSAALE
jgi:uncharacterized protein